MNKLPAFPGFETIWLESCSSTNTVASHWLRETDNSAGAVIMAGEQTAARGRLGRSWRTVAGQDLAFSWAWKFGNSCHLAAIQSESTALNMALAMEIRLGLMDILRKSDSKDSASILIKWPNDWVVWAQTEFRKVGGMLIEPQWSGAHLRGWVIGIGINVNARHLHRPHRGISLMEATGTSFSVKEVAQVLGNRLVQRFDTVEREGILSDEILAAYHQVLAFVGVERDYKFHGETIRAELIEIHLDGTASFLFNGSVCRWSSSDIQGML
ncbi:MAG: biotin--[acetyl-CoA-carboxylase] ligase [Flavobacteriales bacterium]